MGSLENFSGHFNLIWESDHVINNARKRPSLLIFDFLQKIIEHAYLLDKYCRCHGIFRLVLLELKKKNWQKSFLLFSHDLERKQLLHRY